MRTGNKADLLARLTRKHGNDTADQTKAAARHDKHVDEAAAAMSKVKISGLNDQDGKGGNWVKKDYEAACKQSGLPHTGAVGELKVRLGL